MSTLLEFSMTPIGKGESVGSYVSRSLDVVDRSGLAYRLGPMGTCVEGEWKDVLSVVTQCFEVMKKDCKRISVSVKIDYREGKAGRLDSKIQSVENALGRKLKH